MKKKILSIVIVTFCFTNFIYSQKAISDGKVEYEMELNLGDYSTYKAELIFNNEVSKFTYTNLRDIATETNNGGNIRTTLVDTAPRIVYNDLKSRKLFHYDNLVFSKEHFWIVESTQKIDWKLLDETKKIGNFVCNKAIGVFRGRKYTAWYTTKISNSFGPWKLQGLPGLILEAQDEKKEVSFKLKKITIPFKEPIVVNIKPSETIPFEKVKQIKNRQMLEMTKRLESTQDRKFTIKVTMDDKNQIEK